MTEKGGAFVIFCAFAIGAGVAKWNEWIPACAGMTVIVGMAGVNDGG